MSIEILRQPVSVTGTSGTRIGLSVFATGDTSISYEWYENGTTLIGTEDTITILLDSSDDGNTYYCDITDTSGTVTTDTVTLNVDFARGYFDGSIQAFLSEENYYAVKSDVAYMYDSRPEIIYFSDAIAFSNQAEVDIFADPAFGIDSLESELYIEWVPVWPDGWAGYP